MSGNYSISSIPPGAYRIDAELAGYRINAALGEVSLEAKSCAVAEFMMKVDRRVEGTIRTEDGNPASGVMVEMTPQRGEDYLPLLAISGENGFYSIDGILPGDYYLGINVRSTPAKENPYPPTYYPNTYEVRDAVPVSFTTVASVRPYDLTAPAKLKIIRVRGRITDAGGKPPKDHVYVGIEEPGLGGQVDAGPLVVDSEGLFEIEVCEGVRYSAFAFTSRMRSETFSAPIDFIARADSELRLVIDRTAKEFDELRRNTKQ